MKYFFLAFAFLPSLTFAMFGFLDVPNTHSYAQAIHYLSDQNIVSGYGDGNFRPDQKINRAEFTKILIDAQYHNNEIYNCSFKASFSDISLDDWFGPYVCLAQQKGFVEGYPNGTFGPEKQILLTEAAKIISETYNLTVDKSLSPWYAPYLHRLTELNAIPPSLTLPEQALNRGEMAELIYRLATNQVDKAASQLIFKNSKEDFKKSDFDDDQRNTLLTLINEARTAEGLDALTLDPTLNQVAQDFAELMDKENFFSHLSPNGDNAADRVKNAGYNYRFVGENIAKGQVTAQFAFDTWKDSPGHWANIIKPEYKETGLGQFKVTDDNFYKGYFWVQVFGTKQ